MKKSNKFTGLVYTFKNGETKRRPGFDQVSEYNLSDYNNVKKVELFEEGVKRDAVYSN